MGEPIHVYPIADLVEHELTEDCVCGPTAKLETGADGQDEWLIVHEALDGRE